MPWCSHSQHLDLIHALPHNLLQEDLGSNSANEKISCTTSCRPELYLSGKYHFQSSTIHPWQNCMEMMAISKLYLTSEGMLHFSVLQLIQMDNRRRSKRLAENPAAAPKLGFSRSIHFKNFSTDGEKRKPHPSTFSLKSMSCRILLKDSWCLLKEEICSQPILSYCGLIQGCHTAMSRASPSSFQ